MDVDDKSPTPRRQGAQESSAATPQAQPIPKPVLPRLDTRDHPLLRPTVLHATSPESDHLPFPMLTDNIASHEYALHWLTDHPGYTMQGEGLKSIQVPSICPVSPNSPVSSTRCCRLNSGGGWTSEPPVSPESIPVPSQTYKAKSRSCTTAKYKRQKQVESTANTMLSLPCLFAHPHQSPPSIRPLPKPAHLMTLPYQEDICSKPPANLLELRNELLSSFPKIAATSLGLIL